MHWAKPAIINSLILFEQEIQRSIGAKNGEKIPFETVEEALNLYEVKILTNFISTLYITNIPIISERVYETIKKP